MEGGMSKLLDVFSEALKGDPDTEILPSKEEIAARAAEKIATSPMSQAHIEAVILDALEESAGIERHCADVERDLLS